MSECKKTTAQIRKAKRIAHRAVEAGADEVRYRGRFFQIEDTPRGWTYIYGGAQFKSLDAVTSAIDSAVRRRCHR